MNKFIYLIIMVMLISINIGYASKESYGLTENVILQDVIQTSGAGAECNVEVYNKTSQVSAGNMSNPTILLYTYNASILEKGSYVALFNCNLTNSTFYGSTQFEVKGDDNMLLGIIALIPIIFGCMMMFGAFSLGDEHNALRIFLFLLAPVTVWSGLHFASIAIANIYGITEMQTFLSTTTYWMGVLFFLLVSYFVIYLLIKLVHTAAQKKQERLEY